MGSFGKLPFWRFGDGPGAKIKIYLIIKRG